MTTLWRGLWLLLAVVFRLSVRTHALGEVLRKSRPRRTDTVIGP